MRAALLPRGPVSRLAVSGLLLSMNWKVRGCIADGTMHMGVQRRRVVRNVSTNVGHGGETAMLAPARLCALVGGVSQVAAQDGTVVRLNAACRSQPAPDCVCVHCLSLQRTDVSWLESIGAI